MYIPTSYNYNTLHMHVCIILHHITKPIFYKLTCCRLWPYSCTWGKLELVRGIPSCYTADFMARPGFSGRTWSDRCMYKVPRVAQAFLVGQDASHNQCKSRFVWVLPVQLGSHQTKLARVPFWEHFLHCKYIIIIIINHGHQNEYEYAD